MTAEQLHEDNSERLDDSVERGEQQPTLSPESANETNRVTPEQETPSVEDIREEINSVEVERPNVEETKSETKVALPPPNKELKNQSLNKTLRDTRSKLSKPQKTLSKVIHQKQVDAVSNAADQTIARPMGLLFGGLFALIGSILYQYLSHHDHFNYNYIAFTLFFVSGFIIGLIVELFGRMIRSKKA